MTLFQEALQATHKRDASVASPEVHFTNPADFIDDLKADARLGAIEDGIVRLSIVNAPARIEQVEGRWTPGGERINVLYLSKHVEASYRARGQLHKLSCYCGVALKDDVSNPAWIEAGREKTEATAKALQQALRKVQSALAPLDLEVRGGGFAIPDGAWTAHPEGAIETPPTLTCVVCGVEVYWANGHWRGPDRKFEVWVDAGMDGIRPKKALDHEHTPEVSE